MRTRKLRDGCVNPSIQLCLFLFEPSFPSIFFYLCHQTSSLLFFPPNPLRDLTLTSEGQTFSDKEHSCPPTSLVSHSCFGSGLGMFSRFSSLSGPGKDTTKEGKKHSHHVRRPPHQHPQPLAQQMTSVETVELTHMDCLLQRVF